MNFQPPAHISIANAQLPQAYESAKTALANCANIDECLDWADKAAALASYAKQADDDQLEKMAVRIRARAIRRCGELLKQYDARGDHMKKDADGLSPISQREAADLAGMSERQQKQAVRVANVPEPDFTEQVESPKPPTISHLAQQGIKPRPLVDLKGRDPSEFHLAMHYVGGLEQCVRQLRELSHDAAIPILTEDEKAAVRKHIAEVDRITDMIITRV